MTCFDSYDQNSFKILDKAHSIFDLKIEEALRNSYLNSLNAIVATI